MRGKCRTQLIFDVRTGLADACAAARRRPRRGRDRTSTVDGRYRTGAPQTSTHSAALSMRGRLAAGCSPAGTHRRCATRAHSCQFGLRAKVVTIDVAAPTDRRDEPIAPLPPPHPHRQRGHAARRPPRHHHRAHAPRHRRHRRGHPTRGAGGRREAADDAAKLKAMADEATGASAAHLHSDESPANPTPAATSSAGSSASSMTTDSRSHSTNHAIGRYTVDAYWPQFQLVVEVDEDAHRRHLRGGPRARPIPRRHGACARCASPRTASGTKSCSGRRSAGLRESFADE